jgi:signal transduction histidine kinase
MFLEHLWLPGILLAIALSAPFPLSILLSLVMGIPGGLFLNYASFTGVVISISGQNYLYADIAPFFYVPVTLLTVMTGIINFYCGKIRDKSDRLELLVSQINKMNKDITGKIFRIQNDTTLEERKRISKEIHDTSGYVFINLIMILQAASAVLYKDLKKTEQLIDDAIDYADKGINEIRHKLRGIREYTHAFLSLQNELFDIGESFRKTTGVTLTIEYGNWPKTFSKTTDSFFLSFMQECLTNALKHGQASAITIMCWMTDSYIVMSITDNGKGAVMPIKKGIGISAMEDFVSSYNGSINIRSDEGGFRITAVLPLTEPIQS